MTVYALLLREEPLKNQAKYDEYQRVARANRGDHVIKPLIMYGRAEAVEGEAPDGIVLLEFATMEAARAWYNSDGYQQALPHRLASGDYRLMFVEGFTPRAA